MKKILLPALALFMASACVDDYMDANPPVRLDAPTIRLSESGDTQEVLSVPVNRFQSTYLSYIPYDGTATFTVSVIDAPGKIGTVTVTPSVPDYGTVTLNESSVTSIQGQEQGDFTFTYTPNPALPDMADRVLNLVISVSDSQTSEGETDPKTTTITLPTNLVPCIGSAIEAGTYRVTAASGTLDNGTAYTLTSLETTAGGPIDIEISQEFPGRYTVDEVTGGLWPSYYPTRARPTFDLNLCGNDLEGRLGEMTTAPGTAAERTFTVDGVVNGDGTITVTWSYVRADGAPSLAEGSYTLTKQ